MLWVKETHAVRSIVTISYAGLTVGAWHVDHLLVYRVISWSHRVDELTGGKLAEMNTAAYLSKVMGHLAGNC